MCNNFLEPLFWKVKRCSTFSYDGWKEMFVHVSRYGWYFQNLHLSWSSSEFWLFKINVKAIQVGESDLFLYFRFLFFPIKSYLVCSEWEPTSLWQSADRMLSLSNQTFLLRAVNQFLVAPRVNQVRFLSLITHHAPCFFTGILYIPAAICKYNCKDVVFLYEIYWKKFYC